MDTTPTNQMLALISGVPGRRTVGREGKYICLVGVSFDKVFVFSLSFGDKKCPIRPND